MNSSTLQSIQSLIQERWDEAKLRPLPSDDPYDQIIFFLGMADKSSKELNESEQNALRAFLFKLVGLEE